MKQFIIPIAGLETGSHQYEFLIDGLFFEHFQTCEISKCRVEVKMELLKQTDMILLQFDCSGTLELTCDRCLDPFDFQISCSDDVVMKFSAGPEKDKDEDADEFIGAEQQEIDIRQYIFDIICLQVPFRKAHPEDEDGNSQCDPEVLKKLEELSIKKDTDPRWDQLKDLQNN